MYACAGCRRHIRPSETTCPFCGTPARFTTAPPPSSIDGFILTLGFTVIAGGALVSSGCGAGENSDATSITVIHETDEDDFSAAADYGGPDDEVEGWGDGDGDGDDVGDGDGDGDPCSRADETGETGETGEAGDDACETGDDETGTESGDA
jgi:hypothetical protein